MPSPTRNGSFLAVTPTHRLTLGEGYRMKYPRPSIVELFHHQYGLDGLGGYVTYDIAANTIMRFRTV